MVSSLLLLASTLSLAAAHLSKPPPNDDPAERAALIDFGKALDSGKWIKNTHWLSDETICKWHGVMCTDGHVTYISLEHNGLEGIIPSSIKALTKLQVLNLNGGRPATYFGCGTQPGGEHPQGNDFKHSAIPEELYDLTELTYINFEYTCVAGPLSPKIGNLVKLNNFSVHGNFLNGTIPMELNKCTEMGTLKLGRNPFTGGFPQLTALNKLIQFNCNFCSLTGPVPDIFDHFPLLTDSYWDGNGFTGPLPASVAKLKHLERISFNINNLSGPLPDWSGVSSLSDCRIGSDTNLTSYLADYPWIQKVTGNVYKCPISSGMNKICNNTKHCAAVVNPCSPLICE